MDAIEKGMAHEMKIWQIATGEKGRDYRDLFLNQDIMIMGPSGDGDARSGKYQKKTPKIHSFANNPSPGDRILMRLGNKVVRVGQIPEGDDFQYSFEETFRCVYGWDLCHCRRVVWAEKYNFRNLENVFRSTIQMIAFSQVHKDSIVKRVSRIEDKYFKRSLKPMPKIQASNYSDEDLGKALFKEGISNKNIDDILKALKQASRLFTWYDLKEDGGRRPSEHEVVSHMILPLFLGLGWSHQQVAVEWNHVDMAFFKKTPTIKENCVMILEAKGLGNPLSNVLDQPKKYVKNLGLKNVKLILVTDGANLFVYKKDRDQWDENPAAYLNIRYVQKEYPLPPKTNAVDTLVRLQPGAL